MATTGMQMDPLFLAMSFYRRRKFEECGEVCTQLLKKNPYDQVLYFLETRRIYYEENTVNRHHLILNLHEI